MHLINSKIVNYFISPAIPKDAGILTPLAREIFEATFGPFNTVGNMRAYMDRALVEEKFAEELADDNNRFYLVSDHPADEQTASVGHNAERAQASAPVGYIKLQVDLPAWEEPMPPGIDGLDLIYLERFYLSHDCHGSGIAQEMLRHCIAVAKSLKKDAILLGVWEHNHRAQAFYKKHGFQKVGDRQFPFGDTVHIDHWMLLRL